MTKARNIADLGSNDVIETTSTGLDVTGTVTADGFKTDTTNTNFNLLARSSTNVSTYIQNGSTGDILQARAGSMDAGQGRLQFKVANNGDVQFYEDTGTTAKMVWDASAERLDLSGAVGSQLRLNARSGSGTYWEFDSLYGGTNPELRIKNNSLTAVTLDSSGNVGIGTSTPIQGKLTISGSNYVTTNNGWAVGGIHLDGDNSSAGANSYSGAISFGTGTGASAISGVQYSSDNDTQGLAFFVHSSGTGTADSTEAMRLDAVGNLLVGTNISAGALHVYKAGGTTVNISAGSNDAGEKTKLGIGTFVGNGAAGSSIQAETYHSATAQSSLEFHTSGGEKARIDSSGNLLVGTTSISDSRFSSITPGDNHAGYFVNDSSNFYSTLVLRNDATTSTRRLIDFRQGNTVVGRITHDGSSTTYSTTSDYRLKENVVSMDNASDRVKALKPCRFNFIADPDSTVDGFLAHEAQEVVPEAVTGTKDAVDADGNPEYQGIDQSKLVPLLTKALQEALTKIEQLETRIETLENN